MEARPLINLNLDIERTDKMAERVYCLYKVSTAKQVDHDDKNNADIPMQRKACHEFAERMGWQIVGEKHETGVSGYKVSANDRDKLQLIKKNTQNRVNSIYCWYSCSTGLDANLTKHHSLLNGSSRKASGSGALTKENKGSNLIPIGSPTTYASGRLTVKARKPQSEQKLP